MRPFILSFTVLCLSIAGCSDEKKEIPEKMEITWAREIAPIIYKNCSNCHRPGESGPFSLLSYNDAIKKAGLIKFMTGDRQMPPWPADPEYSHFSGEMFLSEEEINLIKEWVQNDTPRGDSTNEPKPPQFYPGSYFGKPDLVIYPPKPVPIKGNGSDAFLITKYPYQIEKDTLVDFVEFVPDQRKLVHHVNGHLVSYDENRSFNFMSGESVHSDTKAELVKVYQEMHIPYTDGKQPAFPMLTPNTVYYLPGYIPPVYPKNVGGYRLKKNGVFLLNNIHYGPSPKDTTDNSHINVFFRKMPVERQITETQMGTFGVSKIEPEFVIPPNEIKTFHTQTTLSKSISLISVNPHMHLIGKKFLAFGITQGGDTVHLIRIKKWDFRWQYYYTFRHPVKLEAGSTIHVFGTFDNTKDNPANPFHPPQTITSGNGIESMKTTEEMFQFIFTYMLYKEGDEKIDLERKNFTNLSK